MQKILLLLLLSLGFGLLLLLLFQLLFSGPSSFLKEFAS
jgi:hypothetical protein